MYSADSSLKVEVGTYTNFPMSFGSSLHLSNIYDLVYGSDSSGFYPDTLTVKSVNGAQVQGTFSGILVLQPSNINSTTDYSGYPRTMKITNGKFSN